MLTLQAVFKYEVGFEAVAFGARTFVGVAGDFKSSKLEYHPFDGLGCGGECDECCVGVNKVSISIGTGGAVAPFWAALKQLEDKIGFECSIGYSSNGCDQSGGFDCKANILDFIPGINGIVKTINATKLAHVHGGLKGGGEAEWCKGAPTIPGDHQSGNFGFKDAKGKFGIFISVGLGPEKSGGGE
jgi:hypothetical protein